MFILKNYLTVKPYLTLVFKREYSYKYMHMFAHMPSHLPTHIHTHNSILHALTVQFAILFYRT